MDLPILMYVSKWQCPACIRFKNEWEDIKQKLNGRMRWVEFRCYDAGRDLPPPPFIADHNIWFPYIMLVGPKSYAKCYDENGNVRQEAVDNNYKFKSIKFNVVKDGDEYVPIGMKYSANDIIAWFNQNAGSIASIDERS